MAGLRRAASARWQGLQPRERLVLGAGGLLIGGLLLWSIAIAPAWRTLRTAPAQIAALDLQLQSMQSQAAEAKLLRATPRLPPTQSAAAMTAAAARLGDSARLSLQGDRAVLTLREVGPGALRELLAEARAGARARPIELALTRGATGYSGQLVLAWAAAP